MTELRQLIWFIRREDIVRRITHIKHHSSRNVGSRDQPAKRDAHPAATSSNKPTQAFFALKRRAMDRRMGYRIMALYTELWKRFILP